jgi:hypothetical protein
MKKLILIILTFSTISCNPIKWIPYEFSPNSSVSIGTEGVSIKAIDGSFEWVYGNDYQIPQGLPLSGFGTSDYSALSIKTTDFNKIKNAIKVMVTTPYSNKPLYGMLQISKINNECKDKTPETRSYYIQVPEQYVRSAQGGKVSVMYESYKCISGQYSNGTKPSSSYEQGYSTWVLWLSDRPL